MNPWLIAVLIWFGSGTVGVIAMSVQAHTRGHSFKDQLKRINDGKLMFFALIAGGFITLAVATEKLEGK